VLVVLGVVSVVGGVGVVTVGGCGGRRAGTRRVAQVPALVV
jgi:hypothetical protein